MSYAEISRKLNIPQSTASQLGHDLKWRLERSAFMYEWKYRAKDNEIFELKEKIKSLRIKIHNYQKVMGLIRKNINNMHKDSDFNDNIS